MINHTNNAKELFESGYNCAQSVFGAFCDITGYSLDEAAKIASGFGGGFSRQREVCGAVSGAVLVLNYLYGYTDPKSMEDKKDTYAIVTEFINKFKERCSSIICRELINESRGTDNSTSIEHINKRTNEYYKKRPCSELCAIAEEILNEIIASKNNE